MKSTNSPSVPISAPWQARLATNRGAHNLTRDDLNLGYDGFVGLGEHERAQLDEIRKKGYLNADAPAISIAMQPSRGGVSRAAKHVGENIKRLREECCWSQDRLAEETRSIDKKTIVNIETGRVKKPRFGTLEQIAAALTKGLGRPITHNDLLRKE